MINFKKNKINKQELIQELLKNQRIMNRVKELNLTKEQIEDALPIMIDMNIQDAKNSSYLISFYVSNSGSIQRTEVLSPRGKKAVFKSNITTINIYDVNFEDNQVFIKDEERKELINHFSNFLNDKNWTKGFYIYGSMGVGKTFIVKRFVKKLAERGYKVGMVTMPALIPTIKSTFGSNEKYEKIINNLKSVRFLFLDDIGAEGISTWFRDEFLFSILNERMDKGLPTFFTSNYSYDHLQKIEARTPNQKYGDFDKAKRLLDRIKALTIPILLNGKNRRF